MSKEHLDLYLNDHLAGSVGALELLLDLIKETDPARSRFFSTLHGEIDADQKALKSIMSSLNIAESSTRKAAAWLMETFAWLKLRPGGAPASNIQLLQSIEGLLLGVTGKRALWQALLSCPSVVAQLPGVDLHRLEERARDQSERIQAERIKVAAEALKL
ncbi:MAG: hypothetical protein JWL90_681 [Chthoniobacteraceae bacterium]|nr:hypothetical protein [Chthoniobacteraceae bacterium]